jgi:hypothetical protein
LVSKILY